MKRCNPAGADWHYVLDQTKFVLLNNLLNVYPAARPVAPWPISRIASPGMAERNQLLNEALAEHRLGLEQQAGLLAKKLQPLADGSYSLTLTAAERETLIQVLNDLRMGSWCTLGQPEKLEPPSGPATEEELTARAIMEVTGYFEYCLIAADLGHA